jgi:hypothetical protein
MILKALTFDIIGTVFDAYDGLAQGVGPLNAKYGLNVQGSSFASGSLAGYSAGVGRFLSGQGWTPPDTVLQDATAGLLPIQQLGPKAPQAIQDFFDLWRALPPWPDVAGPGCRRCINTTPWRAIIRGVLFAAPLPRLHVFWRPWRGDRRRRGPWSARPCAVLFARASMMRVSMMRVSRRS